MKFSVPVAALLWVATALAQIPPPKVYTSDFNSTFSLTESQIEAAQLDTATADGINVILRYDHSQLAFGGPSEDDFYNLPPLTNTTGPLKAGQILKVQMATEASAYSIPAGTSLSRIIYTTQNLNGSVIPASGYVLWPYAPRDFEDDTFDKRARVVIWAHGTSGFFQPQNPSSQRSLWYSHNAPFSIALAGYAVFAPDFAGLGISKSWDGRDIPHEYNGAPAQARDSLYGLRAVREAFSDYVRDEYIVIGHSQGGGTAWGVAEALVAEEVAFTDLQSGYKGSIPVSPTTDLFNSSPDFIIPTVAVGLQSVFPDFTLDKWLTPLGVKRGQLAREIEAGPAAFQLLFPLGENLVKTDFNQTWYVGAYQELANASRKPFRGPLLVVSGTEDTYVPFDITVRSVEATWGLFPDNDLEFLTAEGMGHVPVLDATRHVWLQWIHDRFASKPLARSGPSRTDMQTLLPFSGYLTRAQTIPLWAALPEYVYQAPLQV